MDTIINKENGMEIKIASDRVYYGFEDKISIYLLKFIKKKWLDIILYQIKQF